MKDYPSIIMDNLGKTSILLEEYFEKLEEDPNSVAIPEFQELVAQRRDTIDYRAATIKNIKACQERLELYKKAVDKKLKAIKNLEKNLRANTLDTIQAFGTPFKGNYAELKAAKTRGKIDIGIDLKKATISNIIELDDYLATDIPDDCITKSIYYTVDKEKLSKLLREGLEIKDAKIIENYSLRIREIL